MCRRNQLFGWMLLAFGLGLLIGKCLESGFISSCETARSIAKNVA